VNDKHLTTSFLAEITKTETFLSGEIRETGSKEKQNYREAKTTSRRLEIQIKRNSVVTILTG